MTKRITLSLPEGVRIVVPDSLDLITPYVLQEQQDWFEDEIKFLRRLLQPGNRAIDVGANYGTYTLSMAHTVGPDGHVWAFEPASCTAEFLAESIAENAFGQISLECSAVSDTPGTAELALYSSSELNALTRTNTPQHATETVSVVTLDGYAASHDLHDIDFIKIDAEGEEANILKGGQTFFATESPLVQYEVKAGKELQLGLARLFDAYDYAAYRLIPGIDILAPMAVDTAAAPYMLNLFACKPDRAALLAAAGYLLEAATKPPDLATLLGYAADRSPKGWRDSIEALPYGKRLAESWERTGDHDEIGQAIALYALSHDPDASPTIRFHALQTSFDRLVALTGERASHPRLATLARVARDFGKRAVAVNALGQLCKGILNAHQVDTDEPFLAPIARFDSIDPGETGGNWTLAAALEALEGLQAYSSFFTDTATRARLVMLHDLGYASAEMQRRLKLIDRRHGTP